MNKAYKGENLLTPKQIESILKNADVKSDLLANSDFKEDQLKNFSLLAEPALSKLIQIIEQEHAFYSETVQSYPAQWEIYPDPIQIKSLENVFGVYLEGNSEVNYFDSEDEAKEYADTRINEFYDEDGELDE